MTGEEIAYNEGVRRIEQQEESLSGLHSRASVVVSSSAISTAFLARLTDEARDGHDLSFLAVACVVVALVAFAVVVGCAIAIMWPRDWFFGRSSRGILKSYVDTDAAAGKRRPMVDIYYRLAEYLDDDFHLNEPELKRRFKLLRAALIALGVEIVAWVLSAI